MATRNPDPTVPQNIPAILKHMTVAIFRGSTVPGSGSVKFLNAFNVARANLSRYGYLSGGEEGPVSSIGLTGAGKEKEVQKIAQPRGAEKRAFFDGLYIQWVKDSEVKNKPVPKA